MVCLVVTGLAATFASARPALAHLDADVGSALRADYSKDPQTVRFVPINPEIIEAARDDGERAPAPTPGPVVAPDSSGDTPESEAIEDAGTVEFVPIFIADPTPVHRRLRRRRPPRHRPRPLRRR